MQIEIKKTEGRKLGKNQQISIPEGILVILTKRVDIHVISPKKILLRGYANEFSHTHKEVVIHRLGKVVQHHLTAIPKGHGRFYTGRIPSDIHVVWVDQQNHRQMYVRSFENNFTDQDSPEMSRFHFEHSLLWTISPDNRTLDIHMTNNEGIIVRPQLRAVISAFKTARKCS